MSVTLDAPDAREGEPAPIDLSDPVERERIGPVAARTFLNIMSIWKVGDADARRQLGEGSYDECKALKEGRRGTLDQETLTRISHVIGIFKALNTIHGRNLADQWMQRPNRNAIFGGKAPIEHLARGGLPAFSTLRRLLDARRAGS